MKSYMNLYVRFFLLLASTGLLLSCNSKLDQIQPQQSIDADNALVDDQSVESALVGAYGILGGGSLYGTNLNLLPELLASSGYLRWQGTFDSYRQVSNKTMTAINREAQRTWIDAYQAINIANTVLANLDKVKNPDLKTTLEGEALFIRGAMLFELLRLYAQPWGAASASSLKGVPIQLTSTTNETQARQKVGRSAVAEVYTQVLADLTNAESLLPTSNQNGRVNRYAASAFLARIYLQQGNFAAARDAAHKVISSNAFALNPSVTLSFINRSTRPTTEDIFMIKQNDQNNAGLTNDGLTTFYAGLPGGIGRGDVAVLEDFFNLYSEADARAKELFYVVDPNNANGAQKPGNIRTGKWTDFAANIPVIRLAEMYLIRAETNFRLNTAVGDNAINDLNQIKVRAKLPPAQTITLDSILLERRLELAFEGLRVHDVKRLQDSTGDFAFNSPKLVLPIPQREMEVNNLLVQNEGY
jgi:hypothetical protein